MSSNYVEILRKLRRLGNQFNLGALMRNGCRSYMVLPGDKEAQYRTLFLNVPTPRVAGLLAKELEEKAIKQQAIQIFREHDLLVHNVVVINPVYLELIIDIQLENLLERLDF